MSTGNEIVDQMLHIHLTGNVVPASWYQTIVKENGKPHLAAIAILSDIVFWYRPKEVRDEASGELVGYRKRFRGDLLQRSYGQLAEQFGLSKRQVMAAMGTLEELGVVRKVLRNPVVNGIKLGNVMYLELQVGQLEKLTYPDKDTALIPKKDIGRDDSSHPIPEKSTSSASKDKQPYTKKCDALIQTQEQSNTGKDKTNTKELTQNTTDNSSYLSIREETEAVRQFLRENFRVDFLMMYGEREVVENVLDIIFDVMTCHADTIRVNQENKSAEVVKAAFYKLTEAMVAGVVHTIQNYEEPANNVRGLLITMLYNAVMTKGIKARNYLVSHGYVRAGDEEK